MSTNKKENEHSYKIKEEHKDLVVVAEAEKDLAADDYHKVPGGTIVPQTTEFGGIINGDKQSDIPIMEVDTMSDDKPKQVGVFKRNIKGTPPGKVAPSGLVAPVSQPEGFPPSAREAEAPLIEVLFKSDSFGQITIPAKEIISGENCVILITGGKLSFIPPASVTPITLESPMGSMKVLYCGLRFARPNKDEQYLIMVPFEE